MPTTKLITMYMKANRVTEAPAREAGVETEMVFSQ